MAVLATMATALDGGINLYNNPKSLLLALGVILLIYNRLISPPYTYFRPLYKKVVWGIGNTLYPRKEKSISSFEMLFFAEDTGFEPVLLMVKI